MARTVCAMGHACCYPAKHSRPRTRRTSRAPILRPAGPAGGAVDVAAAPMVRADLAVAVAVPGLAVAHPMLAHRVPEWRGPQQGAEPARVPVAVLELAAPKQMSVENRN